jgi:hypothetical protein
MIVISTGAQIKSRVIEQSLGVHVEEDVAHIQLSPQLGAGQTSDLQTQRPVFVCITPSHKSTVRLTRLAPSGSTQEGPETYGNYAEKPARQQSVRKADMKP